MFVSAAAADRSSIHRCLVRISRRTGLRLGLWQCRRHKASFHIRPFEVSSLRQQKQAFASRCAQHDQRNCFAHVCCRVTLLLPDNVACGILSRHRIVFSTKTDDSYSQPSSSGHCHHTRLYTNHTHLQQHTRHIQKRRQSSTRSLTRRIVLLFLFLSSNSGLRRSIRL